MDWLSLARTASMIGIIMDVVAVLLIHMDRNHVGNMKPSINLQRQAQYRNPIHSKIINLAKRVNLAKRDSFNAGVCLCVCESVCVSVCPQPYIAL